VTAPARAAWRAGALLVAALACGPAQADESLSSVLERRLAAASEAHPVPAIAAMERKDDRPDVAAAVGLRALGQPDLVTTDDEWHIGSDTQTFTATLIGILADEHQLSFDQTLVEALPEIADDIHPAYRRVTVAQLLSHTAGLPPLADPAELGAFMRVVSTAVPGVTAQRLAAAHAYLSRPPVAPPGSFRYSNLGYVIAGAIAEARTGRSWEELVRERIWQPLGITNAGFGPPGLPGRFDQPHGHREIDGYLVPIDPIEPEADAPPALGPAGAIHITLDGWMRFAQDQLEGSLGRGRLLKPATYRRLQTPVSGNQALGWGAASAPDGSPRALAHTGSNGNWLAEIRILPREGAILLVTINAADANAQAALDDVAADWARRMGR
jgi:CubicO group peptidase (beta-lactamase class C family)